MMHRNEFIPATVEVFVRSLSPDGSPEQRPIFDQLNHLSREGVIDYWTVHVVGEKVCPDTAKATEPGQFICARIHQFKEWAERNSMSFGRFFEQRSVSSEMTGEAYETMVLPSLALAEFDEQETLRFVSPCIDGETQHTPMSRLKRIVRKGGKDTELVV